MKKITLNSLLLILVFTFQAQAQLLSPDEFLPHAIGENFTPHHLLVDYYQHVAANSDYVQLIEYGKTNEDRPLLLAFVSTPENLAKLEDIRLNHLRKTGLEEGKVQADLDKAVVWLSFTVHGNEAAGSESAMPVLHELVNPSNTKTKKWLENTIVLLDPVVNPDGFSRYTHWYRRYKNTLLNADLNAIEHNEPWPNGRVNHYLFDLNRDWAWLTQVESQQRLVQYNKWMPHVHADLHEMGINSPYYFAPAAQPFHKYITQWQYDFQETVGKNHAKYFDENGWLFFTKEVFDLLYPSYGDTYPIFNGSIGMTYEQGGSGRAGIGGIMQNGDVLRLIDRINHHKTAALSTIEVTSLNAVALNNEFEKFFKDAQSKSKGKYKTYIIDEASPRAKLEKLTKLLDNHKIAYGTLSSDKKVSAYDYTTNQTKSITAKRGDLIISALQPKGVLTQVLFDPDTEVVDSLTYDITAWSLPYAFGVKAYASSQNLKPNATFQLPKRKNAIKVDNPYAYAFTWESVQDAKTIAKLLRSGIKLRYATLPFEVSNQAFKRGTIIATRADNRNNAQFVEQLSEEATAIPIATGFVDQGKDIGSDSFEYLQAPKVAVVGDRPTSPYSFGQVWHYFEQDIEYPLTSIKGSNFSPSDLDNFNVLILPEGRYVFSEEEEKQLQTWVRNGGKIIAIGSATSHFANSEKFALKRKESSRNNQKKEEMDRRLIKYGEADRVYATNNMPGAIFKAVLDHTHPLGFGMEDHYFSLKTSGRSYNYLENNWNVAYIGDDPIIHGFAGQKAKNRLEKSLVFGVEEQGRGSVIYLIDNPLFRGFWEQGKLVFSNALFLVN